MQKIYVMMCLFILSSGVGAHELSGLNCNNNQIAKFINGVWQCGNDENGGGDITSVSSGTGLTGGGESGDVVIKIDNPLTLTNTIKNDEAAVITGVAAGRRERVIGANRTETHIGQLGRGDSGVRGQSSKKNIGMLGTDMAGVYGEVPYNSGILSGGDVVAGRFNGDVEIMNGGLMMMTLGEKKVMRTLPTINMITQTKTGPDPVFILMCENGGTPVNWGFERITGDGIVTVSRPSEQNSSAWEIGTKNVNSGSSFRVHVLCLNLGVDSAYPSQE